MITHFQKTLAYPFLIVACVCIQAKAQSVKDSINIYAKGKQAPAENFTGKVWVNALADTKDGVNCSMGSVTFEPGVRTAWHSHAGGQVLLITDGTGYYQEKDKPIQIIHKGEVVVCQPNIIHWHGASKDSGMTHIATVPDANKGAANWMQKVTDKEYSNIQK